MLLVYNSIADHCVIRKDLFLIHFITSFKTSNHDKENYVTHRFSYFISVASRHCQTAMKYLIELCACHQNLSKYRKTFIKTFLLLIFSI